MTDINPCVGDALAGAGAAGWQDLLSQPAPGRAGAHIHLLGIGGSGLSAIALLLLERGFVVSGSDQAANAATDDLARRGATVYIGHRAANVAGADLVLVSSAVPGGNPEVQAARAAGIPVVKRADFLGPLMAGQPGVGIAGTHGKTTTTAMLALALWRGGADPSFIIGGRLPELDLAGSAARAGRGPFVIEADEYDRMFLGLPLQTAIVTSVEWDHVDCYPTPADFTAAFRQFAGRLPPGGNLIVCADEPGALALRDAVQPGVTVTTYGLAVDADWRAENLATNAQGGLNAAVSYRATPVVALSLAVPGVHNVRNALAALAAARLYGVPPAQAAATLQEYHGAGRRFEVIGEAAGVTVIDDYGHHPTEVAATLAAARGRYGDRRIWAVFQPHTYTRFKALLDAFTHSFADADEVVLLDIYAAREQNDLGMHSRHLLRRIDHPSAHYLGGILEAASYLLGRVAPGDVVITLSAGDGNRVGQLLLEGLNQQAALANKTERADAEPGARPAVTSAFTERLTGPAAVSGSRLGHEPAGPGEALARRSGQAFTPASAPGLPTAQADFMSEAAGLGVTVVTGELLARHTTFRIGGPADLFATAGDVEQLAALAALGQRHGLPVTVLGGGSNVLVSDRGVRGLVIANAAREVRVATEPAPAGTAPQVVADAGLPLAGLARWAMRNGWSGLEWAVSVPGTVGGAVIGNAGAHDGQIAGNLAWVLVAWPDGRRETWTAADLGYAYRSSTLKVRLAAGQPVPVVLRAGFQLVPGDAEQMAARADEYLARRRLTQPVEPSAGSIFRNPPGDHAGRLIEAAGLKGRRSGGAQISPRHANFIVNLGNARAVDVADLMWTAQEAVNKKFGVDLVPEILWLGR